MSGNTSSITGKKHRLSEVCQAKESEKQRLVSRLLREGYTVDDIAGSLDLSTRTVHRLVGELHKRWQEDADIDYRAKVAVELANLKELEVEAKQAWRRSKRPGVVKRQTFAKPRRKEDGEFDIFADPQALELVEEIVETRGRDGDPRFLAQALACVEDRLKVMGAFRDVNLMAGLITPDQMMEFARAFQQAAEQEIGDEEVLRRVQAKTVELLSNVPTQQATTEPQQHLPNENNGFENI